MILRNRSRYSTQDIQPLIEAGLSGLDTEGILVMVRNARKGSPVSGRAGLLTPRGRGYYRVPDQVRELISIRIGEPSLFPFTFHNHGQRRCVPMLLQSWQEAVLSTAAHEARHIEKRRRKERTTEEDAESHAHMVLEAYRARSQADGIRPESVSSRA